MKSHAKSRVSCAPVIVNALRCQSLNESQIGEIEMRELYYAFYKNSPYQVLIWVSLAEAIYYKKGKFIDKTFVVNENTSIAKTEKTILEKIHIGKKSDITLDECDEWGGFLIKDCLKQRLLSKFLFIYKKNTYFKEEIQNSLRCEFNKDIIKFIDSIDTDNLIEIIPEVKKIKIPKFLRPVKKRGSYKDELEILEDAMKYYH